MMKKNTLQVGSNLVVYPDIVEGEQKKSTLTFLSLEAISETRVLQSVKISCLVRLAYLP